MKTKFTSFFNYLFSLLVVLTLSIGNAWGAGTTAKSIDAGDQYFSAYNEAKTNLSTNNWVSTSGSPGNSGSSYTAPSGWLDGGSGKPGYGFMNVQSGKTVIFTVTNITGVSILGCSNNTSSRTINLSVKLGDSEVGTIATKTTASTSSPEVLTYGSTLDKTKTYTITVSASSGNNAKFMQIKFVGAGSSCAAADLTAENITSDGDQIEGTGITFSKVGNPATGDTWYWQTSATGTDKTYNASTSYTTATTAGSFTVYLRAYNSSSDCWGTAIGKTNTIISCPFDVYNGENVAKGSTTAAGWTINNSSNMALTSGSSNGYSYWYQAGSSSSYVQFDGSMALASGDKIKIQWTHTSANKSLALTINGSSASLTSGGTVTTASTKMEAVYDVTSAVTVTSIKLNSSGSSGCIVYQVSIVKAACASCSAPTSPAISGTTSYTAGDNISLTASATGTDGSTNYTWYKGADWATASAGSSVGTGATFSKNSCVEGDAGTYWCNISNGTGCEVQVSQAITVAAPSCAATIPGNISKGTASGGTGTITLTAAESPVSGDTWYWQSAADGTDKTGTSGATKSVSAAGTYYIRSYNTAGDCWSDAKSVTVDAADLLTAISPTLSYDANVLVGNNLSPTLTGNAGSGSVTYALNDVTPAGSLTINSSTGVVTAVTVGGTATVTASIAANGNYAAGAATSETITVVADPVGNGHVLTWNLAVNTGESSISTTSKSSTSTYVTVTNLANESLTITSAAKDDFTSKIEAPASKNNSKYMYVTFTVADGYEFEPTAVDVNMQAVSAAATADLYIVDGNETLSNEGLSVNKGSATHLAIPNASHKTFSGTVTMKMYCYGSSVATYRFGTPITITGTVSVAATKYNLTFAKGDEGASGSMSTLKYAAGAEVTLPACTFTAPTGKAFAAWVVTKTAGGASVTVTDGKFTMPAEAVTATATWKATYTVNYYDEDGSTPLGSEEVAVGSHPTASSISAEKDYKILTWLLSSVATDLDDVSAAAGATVDLVASYAPAYASSINTEQWVLDNRKNNSAFRAVLDTRHYKYANLNDLDSLTAEKNDGDRNYPFLGQKWKLATSEISFLLKEGSTVKVRFGNMGSSVNVKIGSADAVALTSGSYANSSPGSSKEYSYTATEDVVVKFQGTGTGTVVFKQIMIGEAIASVKLPAIVTYDANGGSFGKASEKYTGTPLVIGNATPADDDFEFEGWHLGSVEGEKINAAAYEPTKNVTLVAKYVGKSSPFSLTALTYKIGSGAATAVGYEEGIYDYTVKLPYAPSYETITVAYTLADGTSSEKAGAVLNVTSVPGAATFTIVAANTTEKTYTVNFAKDAKDGLEIIGATVTGNTSATISGLYGGTASVNLNSKKIDSGGYIYITLPSGYTFEETDVLVVNVNTKADIGSKALEISTGVGNIDGAVWKTIAFDDYITGNNTIALTGIAANQTSIGLKRSSNQNAKINSLKVYRPMNPVLKSITIDGTKIDVTGSTAGETLPYAADLTAVTPEIFWNGAGTAVVTTNAGAWAWGDNTYVLTDKDGDATTYTITLTRATRSSDKSLSSLTVDGNAVELKDGVYDYIYEYPYGTDPATVPVVAAEANDAHASVGTITQAATTAGTASFTVTAEDETTQDYTVKFKISRAPRLVIFDGSTMDAVAEIGADGEFGLAWSIIGANTTSGENTNITVGDKTYTRGVNLFNTRTSSSDHYMMITIPNGYLAKFYLVGGSNGNEERSLFISKEKTDVLDKSIAYATSASNTTAGSMTSDLQIAGDYYLCATKSIRLYELSIQLYPIDHSREVSSKTYGTICLPNGGIMVGATIFEVAHKTYENAQPYKVFFDEVIDGVMEAGMPYIFLPKEDVTSIAVTYTDNDNASAGNKNGLHGTMDDMDGGAIYGKYIFYNNSIFMSENPQNWLSANRAYIVLSEVPDYVTPLAPGRRRVSMNVSGKNTPTGLDEITNDQLQMTDKLFINGQLFILRGEKLYDATGRLVK